MRSGQRHALADTAVWRLENPIERILVSICSKVEHPFHLVRNRFGLKRIRYRGLAKNTVQLFTLLGLANLLIAKWRWFVLQAKGTF